MIFTERVIECRIEEKVRPILSIGLQVYAKDEDRIKGGLYSLDHPNKTPQEFDNP